MGRAWADVGGLDGALHRLRWQGRRRRQRVGVDGGCGAARRGAPQGGNLPAICGRLVCELSACHHAALERGFWGA